jgi:hypothetical protein
MSKMSKNERFFAKSRGVNGVSERAKHCVNSKAHHSRWDTKKYGDQPLSRKETKRVLLRARREHSQAHAHTHTRAHTCALPHPHAHPHAHSHAHADADANAASARTHTHAHARAHAHAANKQNECEHSDQYALTLAGRSRAALRAAYETDPPRDSMTATSSSGSANEHNERFTERGRYNEYRKIVR